MYGGTTTGTYAWSLAQTPVIFMRSGIGLLYQYRTSDALVANSRNHLATQFLETAATHLMWIDADIGFNGLDIVSMLVADQDIICGLYPKKAIDWNRVAQAVTDGVPPEELHRHVGTFVIKPLEGDDDDAVANSDGLVEITAGGTGFMLVKREVFEALYDKVPTYVVGGATIREFYATDIHPETNRTDIGGLLLLLTRAQTRVQNLRGALGASDAHRAVRVRQRAPAELVDQPEPVRVA